MTSITSSTTNDKDNNNNMMMINNNQKQMEENDTTTTTTTNNNYVLNLPDTLLITISIFLNGKCTTIFTTTCKTLNHFGKQSSQPLWRYFCDIEFQFTLPRKKKYMRYINWYEIYQYISKERRKYECYENLRYVIQPATCTTTTTTTTTSSSKNDHNHNNDMNELRLVVTSFDISKVETMDDSNNNNNSKKTSIPSKIKQVSTALKSLFSTSSTRQDNNDSKNKNNDEKQQHMVTKDTNNDNNQMVVKKDNNNVKNDNPIHFHINDLIQLKRQKMVMFRHKSDQLVLPPPTAITPTSVMNGTFKIIEKYYEYPEITEGNQVIFTDDGTSYPGYEVQNVLTRSNRCWCTGYDLNVDFVAKTSVPTLITNVIIQNSGLVCIYISSLPD